MVAFHLGLAHIFHMLIPILFPKCIAIFTALVLRAYVGTLSIFLEVISIRIIFLRFSIILCTIEVPGMFEIQSPET